MIPPKKYITEYNIVSSLLLTDFQQYVNDFLQQGWELYGHPFSRGSCLCQAMIRKVAYVPPVDKPKPAIDLDKVPEKPKPPSGGRYGY